MTSLKRSGAADPYASNIASKVFIRSTKNGKVQKIVRENYLRQDIPCSSKLCAACLKIAPADANGIGDSALSNLINQVLIPRSIIICAL